MSPEQYRPDESKFMQTYYYCPEVDGNFYELASCLVASVQEANRRKEPLEVFRLLEYTDGQQSIHLCTIHPAWES